MSREEFYSRAQIRENCLVDWEDGGAVRMPPAHSRHGYFILHLTYHLDDWLKKGGRGRAWQELFVEFADRTCGADVVVLFTDHLGQHRGGRLYGTPDLVVEVLSPESAVRDRDDKFDYYWKQHVPYYWIGDPVAGTLEEYQWTADGYLRTSIGSKGHTFHSGGLRGFSLELDDLLDTAEPSEQPS